MEKIKTGLIYLSIILSLLGVYLVYRFIDISVNSGSINITTNNQSVISYIYGSSTEYHFIGSGNQVFKIKPGNYTILFSYENTIKRQNVTITKGGDLPVSVSMSGLSQQYQKTANFIKLLPYYGPGLDYSFTYSYSFTTGVAVPVVKLSYTSQQALNNALAWLEQIGVVPGSINMTSVEVTSITLN